MRSAFGSLKWTPEVFWRSTVTEYILAIEGFNEANGSGKKTEPPSDDDLARLVEKYGG
ncbi:conserved protein of unknown function [Aminobacter niigataensis]|nr:conserved protein of unknown function [Aminobacter niigataensis]